MDSLCPSKNLKKQNINFPLIDITKEEEERKVEDLN